MPRDSSHVWTDELDSLLNKTSELWMKAHDLVDRARALTAYGVPLQQKLQHLAVAIEPKCDKMLTFFDQLIDTLFEVEELMEAKDFKLQPKVEDGNKKKRGRPTSRKHDSASRSTKSRKDTVRKPVSWADLVARNRSRT